MSNISYTLTAYQTELQSRLNSVSGSTTNKQLIILGRALELNPGMTTTTYAAEVQSRITATNATTTDKELLELAVLIGKIDNDIFDQVPVSTADLATRAELAALTATVDGLVSAVATSTFDASRTGYVASSSLIQAGGEDIKYINITISAVPDVNKCRVVFVGGASEESSAAASFRVNESDRPNGTFQCTARLTSTTNLRISCPNVDVLFIAGRYYVEVM